MSRIIVTADEAYAAHPRSRMDILVPEGVARPPLVMLIHGGGWHGGHRLQWLMLAYALASRGFAAATVGYPLVPDLVWPGMGHHLYGAAVHLRKRAKDLGYEGSRMVTCGSSAGAQLSIALQAFASTWRREGAVAGEIPEILGTVAQSPAFDLFGFAGELATPFVAGASPETVSPAHLDPSLLRSLLVLHSRPDQLFPCAEVEAWVVRLRRQGVDAEARIYDTGEHGFAYSLIKEPGQKAFEDMLPYLERIFGCKASAAEPLQDGKSLC